MVKAIRVKQKKLGRPATGHDPLAGVRMPAELRERIERWASMQEDQPSFSEAVRRLIERGLRGKS